MSYTKIESQPYYVPPEKRGVEFENGEQTKSPFDLLFDDDGYRSVLFTMIGNFAKTDLPCPKQVGELREANPEVYASMKAHLSDLVNQLSEQSQNFSAYYNSFSNCMSKSRNHESNSNVNSDTPEYAQEGVIFQIED